jgi:phage shock protein C
VAITILEIITTHFNLPLVDTFIDLFEILIFPLAVLILLLGYVGIITSFKNEKTPKKSIDQTSTEESIKKETGGQREYKRLYRSGKDRILGGVLGGLAEYLNVDPTIIRILYILLLFASVGFIILAYLIGWMLIPRNPNHTW